jgi:hypothetical protein
MRPGPSILAAALTVALAIAGCGSSNSSSSGTAHAATTSSAATTTSSAATSTSTAAPTSSTTTPAAPSGKLGPEGIVLESGPQLAPASSTLPGTTINGVQCAPSEQIAYHIHAHLQVYVDGQPRLIPAAIGLVGPAVQQTPAGPFYGAQKCYYWLHTHTTDGIIHIESPTKRIYTLGNFFDEWNQPLTADQVAASKGKVTAFLNGKRWKHNPRSVPLESHFQVQLDVGHPVVPFRAISFSTSGL